jgi:hypothetical protein
MSTTDWLTLALVVITTFYAWATFRILRANEHVVSAMRDQTEAQLRPYVVAYVSTRIGTTLLHLTIKNTGKSAALDLRLAMDKSFIQNGEGDGADISKNPAFTEPIASLAPGGRLPFILGVGHSIFAGGAADVCPKLFIISAKYRFGEREYEEANTIDLRPLYGTTAIQDPIADEIKALREKIDEWVRKIER